MRGLYRQYTLIYVVADERDLIRVRSNYRHGENVYLYNWTLASPPEARERFLEYIQTINNITRPSALVQCRYHESAPLSIGTQRLAMSLLPWDWRILVNGKGDELLYERHVIATGRSSFPRAQAAQLYQQTCARSRPGSGFLAPHPRKSATDRLAVLPEAGASLNVLKRRFADLLLFCVTLTELVILFRLTPTFGARRLDL